MKIAEMEVKLVETGVLVYSPLYWGSYHVIGLSTFNFDESWASQLAEQCLLMLECEDDLPIFALDLDRSACWLRTLRRCAWLCSAHASYAWRA